MLLAGNVFSRAANSSTPTTPSATSTQASSSPFYDTPNFTGENGGVPGMPTEEDVEERKLDWGEPSRSYETV